MEIIAGVVIYNPRLDKFLVLQSKYGYDLPKGHVEAGEPLLDGALRECFEETGLTPQIHPEWSVTLSKKRKKYHFYLGIVHTTSVQLSFEHDKAFWADARFAEKLKKPLRIAVQTAILFLE